MTDLKGIPGAGNPDDDIDFAYRKFASVPAASAREQTAEWGDAIRSAITMLGGGEPYYSPTSLRDTRNRAYPALAALLAEVEQLREERDYFDSRLGDFSRVAETDRARAFAAEAVVEQLSTEADGLRDQIYTDERIYERMVAAEAVVEQQTAALAVIPPDRLEALADWIDLRDLADGRDGTEVQNDLRRMARLSRAALRAGAEPENGRMSSERDLKKHLRDLTASVSSFLTQLDEEMALPGTPARGKRIAALANDLNFANDRARYFGLGIDFRTDGRPRTPFVAIPAGRRKETG